MKEYYARRAAEYDATSWQAFDEAERAMVERFVASRTSTRPQHALRASTDTRGLLGLPRPHKCRSCGTSRPRARAARDSFLEPEEWLDHQAKLAELDGDRERLEEIARARAEWDAR